MKEVNAPGRGAKEGTMDLTKILVAGAVVASGAYAYKKYKGGKDDTSWDADGIKQRLQDAVQAAYREGEPEAETIKRALLAGSAFAVAHQDEICQAVVDGLLEPESTSLESWLEALGEEMMAMGYDQAAGQQAYVELSASGALDEYQAKAKPCA